MTASHFCFLRLYFLMIHATVHIPTIASTTSNPAILGIVVISVSFGVGVGVDVNVGIGVEVGVGVVVISTLLGIKLKLCSIFSKIGSLVL